VLLAIDLYENFINEESITVATMISLQAPGVFSAKFDAASLMLSAQVPSS